MQILLKINQIKFKINGKKLENKKYIKNKSN